MTTLTNAETPAAPQPAFRTTGRVISEADVAVFAALSGDYHPQHTDAAWARESRFGERVAHGMLVLSCATGLAPCDPDRVVALRRIEATFKAPVRLGDEITVEGEFDSAKRLDAAHDLVTFVWRVRNQAGKTVVRAEVDVVWRKQPDDADALVPGVLPL